MAAGARGCGGAPPRPQRGDLRPGRGRAGSGGGAGRASASERIPLRLVTNTTMRPRRTILERLERLGIEADPGGAAHARRPWRRAAARRPATSRSPWSSSTSSARTSRASRSEGDSVDAVIVGDLGERWDYDVLNRAFRQADGRRRADRAAEEPLLGDRRGSLARRGARSSPPSSTRRDARPRWSASPPRPSSSWRSASWV